MIDSSIPSPFGPLEQNLRIEGKISINVEVDGKDEIFVTQAVNPQFDLNLMTEALGMMILVASKYTERPPEDVLADTVKTLRSSVKFKEKVRFKR